MTRVFGTLGLSALLALPAAAQVDVTGKWEMTFETPRGAVTQVLVLEQSGTTVTGTAEVTGRDGPPGGGGGRFTGAPRALTIESGAIDGATLTFTIVRGMGQRAMTTEYRGTVDGDTISGTMTTPRGERPFTAVRVETD